MNRRPLTTLLLLAGTLPLGVAFVSRGDVVRFQPEDGSAVDRELDLEATFYLDDIQAIVDGQEMPAEMIMGQIDGGILFHLAMEVSDEFVKSADGRPVELVRSYDSMTLEGGPEGQTEEMEDTPEIIGNKVRFRWDADEDAYVKTFADDESGGDEDLLEGLEVDMDYLALLPEDEVSEGDSWTVKGDAIGTVFFPGGFSIPEPEGDDAEIAEMISDMAEEQLGDAFADFEVECKYVGAREGDDGKLGEIAVSFDGDASIDLTELIMTAIEMQTEEIPMDIDATVTMDLEFEGEGVLLWDLEAGRTSSFELKSEITVMVDASAEVAGAPDGDHSLEASVEVSGEAKWELEAN